MTPQTILIILSIVLFVWDVFNKKVNVKLESLAWAALVSSYVVGRF